MMDQLGLKLEDTDIFCVKMGIKVEKSRGICKGMLLGLQEIQVIGDFLPLDLGNTDVILGIKWLQMLGMTQVNWEELTMTLQVEGCTATLQGEFTLSHLEDNVSFWEGSIDISAYPRSAGPV